jgi:hypothetical protein
VNPFSVSLGNHKVELAEEWEDIEDVEESSNNAGT